MNLHSIFFIYQLGMHHNRILKQSKNTKFN